MSVAVFLLQEIALITRSNVYHASPKVQPKPTPPVESKTDILVAGSVAIDLSCDYSTSKAGDIAPQAHVSNPAHISQSIGGVGHNVALAAHLVSREAQVKLCSMVGDDVYALPSQVKDPCANIVQSRFDRNIIPTSLRTRHHVHSKARARVPSILPHGTIRRCQRWKQESRASNGGHGHLLRQFLP